MYCNFVVCRTLVCSSSFSCRGAAVEQLPTSPSSRLCSVVITAGVEISAAGGESAGLADGDGGEVEEEEEEEDVAGFRGSVPE